MVVIRTSRAPSRFYVYNKNSSTSFIGDATTSAAGITNIVTSNTSTNPDTNQIIVPTPTTWDLLGFKAGSNTIDGVGTITLTRLVGGDTPLTISIPALSTLLVLSTTERATTIQGDLIRYAIVTLGTLGVWARVGFVVRGTLN